MRLHTDNSDEEKAAADKLEAEIFEGTEAENKKQPRRNRKVVDDGKNNKLERFLANYEFSERK